MTQIDLLTFSMRSTPPKEGAEWFSIVEAKKADEPTKVYIYDEIGFWGTTAKDFAALVSEIDSSEIELHLNSPGGSVFDGLAIMAALKNHKATVTAVVDGLAASAASFILQAADTRHSTRNAQIMIHDAKAYAGGNAKQMRSAADLLDRVSDNIADIYAVRSKQGDLKSWRKIMVAGDKWYSGNEAKDAGLVDDVLDNPEEDEDEPEEANNTWSSKEVEAFLSTPAHKLAANADQLTIKNQVEEALMTGPNPQNTQQPAATPPQPPALAGQQTQQPDNKQPDNQQQTSAQLIVNGQQVNDMSAVQAHITTLETFRKETVEGARKQFVADMVKAGKLLAGAENVTANETFALSLSPEQFASWKTSMEGMQASGLFSQHGATPGDEGAPSNGGAPSETDKQITIYEEIVQEHRNSGLDEEQIQKKDSYKKLQALKAQKSGS